MSNREGEHRYVCRCGSHDIARYSHRGCRDVDYYLLWCHGCDTYYGRWEFDYQWIYYKRIPGTEMVKERPHKIHIKTVNRWHRIQYKRVMANAVNLGMARDFVKEEKERMERVR